MFNKTHSQKQVPCFSGQKAVCLRHISPCEYVVKLVRNLIIKILPNWHKQHIKLAIESFNLISISKLPSGHKWLRKESATSCPITSPSGLCAEPLTACLCGLSRVSHPALNGHVTLTTYMNLFKDQLRNKGVLKGAWPSNLTRLCSINSWNYNRKTFH